MVKRLLALLLLCATGGVLVAQDIEPLELPTGFEPIAITFPVPAIYVSGDLPIVGTVNVAGLNNYFVEIRELRPAVPGAPEAPWTPATLPSRVPVLNSVITVLDTTLFPDGLYEIRLAVTTGSSREYFRVSPIRIVNNPMSVSPYLALMMAEQGGGSGPAAMPTPTSPVLSFPTAAPTQPPPVVFVTATPSGPYVQSFVNANVRQGDSTAYPIVGSLLNGSTAPIIGISTTGSGWYYIQLPNGVRGFISPTTVTAFGSTVGVPPVAPPPPPTAIPSTATPTATLFPMITPTPSATLTPTPTATPTLIFIPPVITLFPLATATPTSIFFPPIPITLIPIPTLIGP
ncbi:MAG: SH3 domain-containing protein [Anaerolineae bacterium]